MNTLRTAVILVALFCAIAILTGCLVQLVRDAREHKEQAALVALSQACHTRWSKNGRYKPMRREVQDWLEMVAQLDTVVNDVEWYAALIDLESLGDSTTNAEEGTGRSYGLGCITIGTAREMCKRNELEVTNLRYSLLNPSFNIRLMVLHVEGLYYKYDGDLRRVLLAYNSGEPRANVLIAREEIGDVKLKYTHHRNHKERLEQIRAVIFQQGARR